MAADNKVDSKKLNPLQQWKKDRLDKKHNNDRYLIVESGYTSRLVKSKNDSDGFKMDLVVTGLDKENRRKNKTWETSFVSALTKYHDKLQTDVKKTDVKKTDKSQAILILDHVWGEGLYVNPKARSSDILFILDTLKTGDEYDQGIIAFTVFENVSEIVQDLQEREYCQWYKGPDDYVKHINYGEFDLAYVSPDTES